MPRRLIIPMPMRLTDRSGLEWPRANTAGHVLSLRAPNDPSRLCLHELVLGPFFEVVGVVALVELL